MGVGGDQERIPGRANRQRVSPCHTTPIAALWDVPPDPISADLSDSGHFFSTVLGQYQVGSCSGNTFWYATTVAPNVIGSTRKIGR